MIQAPWPEISLAKLRKTAIWINDKYDNGVYNHILSFVIAQLAFVGISRIVFFGAKKHGRPTQLGAWDAHSIHVWYWIVLEC